MTSLKPKKGDWLVYTGNYAPEVSEDAKYGYGYVVGFREHGEKVTVWLSDSGHYADWPVDETAPAYGNDPVAAAEGWLRPGRSGTHHFDGTQCFGEYCEWGGHEDLPLPNELRVPEEDTRVRREVAVVVLLSVEGVDYGDAGSAGEQLVAKKLGETTSRTRDGVKWTARVHKVREVGRAAMNGDLIIAPTAAVVDWKRKAGE